MAKPAQSQLYSLQQSRGLAAMAVVAFHVTLGLSPSYALGQEVFANFTRRGNLGVDFFFVLSGFIIVFAHGDDIGRPDRLRNYLTRRFTRLFPVYWIYLAVFCALVAIGFGTRATLPEGVTHWISTIFLIRLDSFIFPIAPAWTLVHELAFYLVFALLIAGRRTGVAVFALWMVGCLLVGQYPDYDDWTPWTSYFSPLNVNFLVGMLAFYAWVHCKPTVVKCSFVAGLALLVAVYMLETRGVSYSVLQIAYAIAFGMILSGAAALESDGLWPPNARLLNLIGDASYSIYLTHVAFIGLLTKAAIRFQGYMPLPPQLIFFAVFVGTIVCGCALHLFVERPLIDLCRKRFAGSKRAGGVVLPRSNRTN